MERSVASCIKVNQLLRLGILGLAVSTAVVQTQAQHVDNRPSPPAIVVGFVGGFVHRTDTRHSEVQLIRDIQSSYGDGVRTEVFENRQRKRALHFILTALDVDSSGELSDEEQPRTTIILFGHSWGASAAVYLARDLRRRGIAVALIVQVDSISKRGEDDSVIPPNVRQAINFYQEQGVLHGRQFIIAPDPARTTILGNIRFRYEADPPECRAYPWYNRIFFKGHTAIECDPRVWSQVNSLIRERLPMPERQFAGLLRAYQTISTRAERAGGN